MAKQATIRHSATARGIQKRPTLKHLFAAHRRAFDRLQITTQKLSGLKEEKFSGILVYTLVRVKPGDFGAIPPIKKGELRTVDTHAVASNHEDIDRLSNAYIKFARKQGKWGYLHDGVRGRLDHQGIFHALDAPNCPPDGRIVIQGRKELSPFTKQSLAEYRARVRNLHERLDVQIEATKAANEANGWAAAKAEFTAAKERERAAWESITKRATTGTANDIRQVCRYQRNLLEREWKKNCALGDAGLDYYDFMAKFTGYAQDIAWAIARPWSMPKSRNKAVLLTRKAA